MSQQEASMQAYVVYNRESGQIAHIHVEATLEGEPRRLERDELIESLVLARDEKLDASSLDVLDVPYDELERRRSGGGDLYVDPQRRELAGAVRAGRDEPELSKELAEREGHAREFAEREDVVRALLEASREPSRWEEAERSPTEFLNSRGIDVPDGLAIEFSRDPRGRPVPDYEFFTIRLFNCRTYWIKKPGGVEKVEVCFGFEIVPHPLPPIA